MAHKKPQMLVCYLCGQQFGSSSLAIHQPQCYQKQLAWWKQADPGTRGPKPKDPAVHGHKSQDPMSAQDVQKFNDDQFQDFNSNLAQCPNCGRTFLPDRLAVHLRSCNPTASGGGSKPPPGRGSAAGSGASAVRSSPGGDGSRSGSRGSRRSKGGAPQLLICYMCGKQFGSSSLGIHMPQCYDRALREWKDADKGTRGPRPVDPSTIPAEEIPQDLGDEEAVERWNQRQFKKFDDQMSACPNCGRTFLPDRLAVHLRSCNPDSSGGGSKGVAGKAPRPQSRPSGGAKPTGPGAKPQMLVCYLCGQQFGSASLAIHQPQCYQKQLVWWKQADPGTRGPKPKDPAVHGPTSDQVQGMSVDEFNEQQFQDFNSNLAPCPNCGRTFNADRLVVHLRSCKPDASGGGSKPPPGRGPPQGGGAGGGGGGASPAKPKGPGAKPQMLVCYLCGQQFGSASLPIHQPQCFQKKTVEWERADPATRGPPPKDPAAHGPSADEIAGMSRDEFNQQQFQDFNSNLAQCPNCGRTFNHDRLEVHLRSCKPGASGGGSKPVQARAGGAGGGGGAGGAGGRASATPSESARTAQSDEAPSVQTASSGPRQGAPSRSPLVNRAPADGAPEGRDCPGCGSVEYDSSARFCQECGQPLAPAPAPSAAQSAAAGMVCSSCGTEWPEGKFCQECGSALVPQGGAAPQPPPPRLPFCSDCGLQASAADARFCEDCGTPLQPVPAAGRTRTPSPAGSPDGEEFDATVAADASARPTRWAGASACPSELPQVDAESTVAPSRADAAPGGEDEGGDGGDAGEGSDEHGTGDYGASGDYGDEGEGGGDGGGGITLLPCANCGRKFAAQRLAKHQKVCSSMRKRKVFNSHAIRVNGTEMAGHQHTYKRAQKGESDAPKVDWKSKSAAFRDAMKQARLVDKVIKEGGDLSKLPPPSYTKEEHDDRVPCPHCGRKFAADTAERHIPKCATTMNRPKAPPKRAPPPAAPAPQRRGTPPGKRGSSPGAASPSSTSPVPDDVARMGVSPEKWQRMQDKKAKEWEEAYGDAPSDVRPCPNCGRKFVPSSLDIHLRSCGGRHGMSKPSPGSRGSTHR